MKLEMKAHMVLKAIAVVEAEFELPKKQRSNRYDKVDVVHIMKLRHIVEQLPGNATVTLEDDDIYVLRAGLNRAYEAEKERYREALQMNGEI